ncbi:MBL fold metallo-hydrolase [Staphylococcus warneri]|uniref:MBL fold metallo-hydrolase n=1 Tax=Staphylococcus warneri TaxID=1292 RepID=UPI00119CF4E3|nr:MBL fold metallo-hydrolase [Staphylococcus warneri]WNF18879.1 MBL fold metallo-hydrolase [Staphylococcus warneri]
MQYEIISTGSKGNSVVINDIMIDCGIAFKKLKEYLYDIKYLLLTHIHNDHIKPTTLKRIRKEFPHIKVISNYEVAQLYDVDHIINAGYPIDIDNYTFEAFECVHDVVTYGYVWTFESNEIIYATDTNSLENAPERKYDYLFLESNYDEEKLELARGKRSKYGYDPYISGLRHLSTKDCKTFYYLNRRDKTSELIELHMSERFY